MTSQRSSRRSTQKRKSGSQGILHLKSGSPHEIRAMNSMIESGPVTIMLVFSRTCPHCVTYMPIWKKLCKTQGRKANMISMEASTYQATELSQKKPVSGVPSVLYVNPQGEITEASEPRNTTVMTNAVRVSSESDLPASVVASNRLSLTPAPLPPVGTMTSEPKAPTSNRLSAPLPPVVASNRMSLIPATMASETNAMNKRTSSPAVIPGTMSSENPLKPLPAIPIQSGGNPWAAFLLAAKQAAPAAALLGAYVALPAKRSSGLTAPRRTRRRKSHRRFKR